MSFFRARLRQAKVDDLPCKVIRRELNSQNNWALILLEKSKKVFRLVLNIRLALAAVKNVKPAF